MWKFNQQYYSYKLSFFSWSLNAACISTCERERERGFFFLIKSLDFQIYIVSSQELS